MSSVWCSLWSPPRGPDSVSDRQGGRDDDPTHRAERAGGRAGGADRIPGRRRTGSDTAVEATDAPAPKAAAVTAAAAVTLSVTPDTGLVRGQSVAVSASGLPAGN